ncbi:MAG TPA: hypothetical protein DHI91_01425 [Candidatus Portnoybacteria bacterium]|nr:hypothetical protein [Candidatus Portnoybacteria bacterium]
MPLPNLIAFYAFYTLLGILPSFIWLVFYLHKDVHPEPNKMVLKVFLAGALMGPVAIFLELVAMRVFNLTPEWPTFFATLYQNTNLFLLNVLLFAPLVEEGLKYLAVKWQVLKNPAFDEPFDAMLYLVISGLGFAAVENLLSLFLAPNLTLQFALSQTLARFLSATFLHTLSSGILGYFLARSFLDFKNRRLILGLGFVLAVAFHSFYNYLAWLMEINKFISLAIALYLILMASLVTWQFQHLRKQPAICKVDRK